jgi:hypothetical protein
VGKAEHLIKPSADDEESNSVCTAAEVLDPIYENFGYIALDPYSYPLSIVRAETYIELPKYKTPPGPTVLRFDPGERRTKCTVYGDGNTYRWPLAGLVYCNPAFDDLHQPLAKIRHEAARGVEIIALLPARTGHDAVQRVVSRATSIIFWRGRMKFVGMKDTAPFQTMLVYWGKRPELFARCWPGMWRVGA